MIEKYMVRVTRAWQGVHNGQEVEVDKRRRDRLVNLGFAVPVEIEKPKPRKPAKATPKDDDGS